MTIWHKKRVNYDKERTTARAYLEIVIEWTSNYNVDDYDVGYLLLVDGDYEEEMCKEKDDGNYCKLEIKL